MRRIIYAAEALLFATTTMNAQQSISLDLNVRFTGKVPTTNIAKDKEEERIWADGMLMNVIQ